MYEEFEFYEDYYQIYKELEGTEAQVQYFDALFEYAFNENVIEITDPDAKDAFERAKALIDSRR